MRTKQLSLLPKEFMIKSSAFGGALLVGKRKSVRPPSTKEPFHLVLKSNQAKGELSFVNNRKLLDGILQRSSKKWGVKILRHEWVWDHLHGIFMVSNRALYKAWIRELTSEIVKALSQRIKRTLENFFPLRPFTRIIKWGRDLKNAFRYLELNQMELFGCRPAKQKARKSNICKPPDGSPSRRRN